MPHWVQEGYTEYARRMPPHLGLELQELPLAPRGKSGSAESYREGEADRILAALSPGDYLIALDVRGKTHSTEQVARRLANWEMQGIKRAVFLIGGPDGLSGRCLQRADETWSLSNLTLPHPLVRVVLAEQLYRACMINAGHPYHRE